MKFIEVPTSSGPVLLNVAQIVSIGVTEGHGTYIELAPTTLGEQGLCFVAVPYHTLRRELIALLVGQQVFHSFVVVENK